VAAALQHDPATQCLGIPAPGAGGVAAPCVRFGYASANARGWSIGGQNPNLRTGVIPGGRSPRFSEGTSLHDRPRLLAVLRADRRADPVWVVVNNAQGNPLGAQVPAAPDVIGVAPYCGDAAVSDLNLQAAHGFTQRTGVEVAAGRAGSIVTHLMVGRRRPRHRGSQNQPGRPRKRQSG